MPDDRATASPRAERTDRPERVDALTDGVFAIAATLLVLEVHVPTIPPDHSGGELWHSLVEVAPSFVAFAFSFLTILVYWVNHHSLSRVIVRYPYRLVWLNLLLLFWISMIPFTTKFISEYPAEPAAVITYGLVMFLTGVTATLAYCHAAFWADVMSPTVGRAARVRLLQKWSLAAVAYLVAMASALFEVRIAIAIYIAVPLMFFVPALQEGVLDDLGEGEAARN